MCMLFEGEEVEISELTWFQKLIWTPTINKKQRFVVEQVAYGRNTLKDLIDYFGAREDNFKRTIEYLLQKSILIEFGGAYVISEEAIHQEFRQS